MHKLNTIQKNLYQLLVELDEICKRYDIDYLLAGGASLGSIRNRRFMPWDDDIDLFITRDNWEKLRHIIETEENVLPEGRSMVYKENTPYYCNPLPRYVNTETTTIYSSQSLPAKSCGHQIEFFIFNPMPLGEKAKEEYLDILHVYTELLSPYFVVNKRATLEEWEKHYELYEHYCHRIDEEGEEKVLKELEDRLKQYSPKYCDQYCVFWGYNKHVYDKEHFQLESEMGQFEDGMFPLGYRPEGLLRSAYGDSWMYIPEYEEQLVHNAVRNDYLPFEEYSSRYLPKINRESIFEKCKINKRNNAKVYYKRRKVEMLIAKEIVAVGSVQISKDLDGKDDYLRSLLDDKDYDTLFNEFENFTKLQNVENVFKYNILVPISDKNLATYLFALIDQGKYYDASKYLDAREQQEKPLNDELNEIKEIISICHEISVARYDLKDIDLVRSLVKKYEIEYADLLDIYRAKIWIMENTADSIEDYKMIDEFCNHVLSLYPFDGETMAFQAKSKFECGHEKEAMKLYRKSIDNTRNGIIWQKVEDESGISRMDMEADFIEAINGS
ncbi:MAG: LicD family protein [Methanobrevibacter sp.]|uniref:LicD family protein n=1 Tax=Methanobrevibacter sp. TaxID=66852 RepID=UPI0025FE5901|nr:LicD family protein [Methanobrevibacter sp.]MBR6993503.1 LicD family protein [Methanobrevibacter sp.]